MRQGSAGIRDGHRDRDARMTRPESGHRRRHDRRGSGGEHGQAQCAAPQPGDGLELGLGFPEVAKDRAGAVGERLARRGQPYPASPALDEQGANLALELSDLLGDGGLAVVEPPRGR